MKTWLAALSLAFSLGAVGCGGSNGCLPGIAANNNNCPSTVYIDATTTDPVCLTTQGVALCRGDLDAVCYHCTGASFSDGCVIRMGDQAIECVHSCGNC